MHRAVTSQTDRNLISIVGHVFGMNANITSICTAEVSA